MRRRFWSSLLLAILSIAVLVWVVLLAAASPRYRKVSPRGPVEIVRDDLGVPHVFATNRHDLFFAQGYVTAADRIFQIDWSRRGLLGRRAQVAGRREIVSDFQARALNLDPVARDIYAGLDAGEKEAVDAFADGVNEWLRTHPLPVEFQRLGYRPAAWRPYDCLLIWRGLALTLTDLTDDLDASQSSMIPAGPGFSVGLSMRNRPAGPEARPGSNAWAVGGRWTRSGHPLLAGDPHLDLTLPGAFCRVSLTDSLTAATGFAVPGVPGLVMGRTRGAAWTPTAFEGDASDVFTFPVDPQDSTRYRGPAGWVRVERRKPVVWLRLWGPVSVPVFWQSIEETPWGPVLGRERGRLLVLRWAGARALPDEGLPTVLTMAARGIGDIESALARQGLPDINVVCADTGGHIACFVAGRLPRRARHDEPRDGLDSTLAWRGFIPFEALPRTIDPPEGMVVNANGPPPPGDEYLGRGWSPAREMRIRELLAARDSLDLESFQVIQSDRLVPGAREEVSRRLAVLDTETATGLARAAAGILRTWDGRAEVDSVGPTIFRAWQSFGEGKAGLEEACAWLAGKLGPDPREWRWGLVHQALLRHPLGDADSTLNAGPFPRGGDRGTLDMASYRRFDTRRWPPALSRFGPAARFLADLAPGDGQRGVLLAGQSGDPRSTHYADQLDAWQTGEALDLAAPGARPEAPVETEWLLPKGAPQTPPH